MVFIAASGGVLLQRLALLRPAASAGISRCHVATRLSTAAAVGVAAVTSMHPTAKQVEEQQW